MNRNRVLHGGKPLLLAYPVYGSDTFRPSGNPQSDPPEISRQDDLDLSRELLGLNTREGAKVWDQHVSSIYGARNWNETIAQCAYWDRIRFLQAKTPRARRRAEKRLARK